MTPTATHEDAAAQETDLRSLLVPTFGLGTTDRALPSQSTTNVSRTSPLNLVPTAAHDDAVAQKTEDSTASDAPEIGSGTTDHAAPSHTSIRVVVAVSVLVAPTAVHQDEVTHDTEVSQLPVSPGFGLFTIAAASIAAPAVDGAATKPRIIATTAATARTGLRTIRHPESTTTGALPIADKRQRTVMSVA